MQTIFGIENYDFYVTGESYAGRCVPYVADAMLDRQDECYFTLSGKLASKILLAIVEANL